MVEYKTHNGLTLKEISPHEWPARVGELTILLSCKVGYCGIITGISQQNQVATVYLLDYTSEDEPLQVPLYDCVPTRKSPEDLIKYYHPTPQQFSIAVSRERDFPDFDSPALSKSRRSSTKTGVNKPKLEGAALVAALALLSPAQKEALASLFKKNKKETK